MSVDPARVTIELIVRSELSEHVDQKLDLLATNLTILTTQVTKLMALDAATQAAVDRNTAATTAATTVEGSIETLLTGLSAQIAALKIGQTNPDVIKALDDSTAIIEATTARASAAVVANTPAAAA